MRKIFIALDTKNKTRVKKIISSTKLKAKNYKIYYKFGLEFFYSKDGRNLISKFNRIPIFLDLKLNDIPNTAVGAIKSLKDLKNINYLTVHMNGGYEMVKKVKSISRIINRKIKIIGVTVLTSLSSKSIKEIGFNRKISNIVVSQAKLAKKAKLDGIVCSAHEIKVVKKICKGMEIITPGIRLDKKKQDQKRVLSPSDAFKNGATAIVIGRPVTKGNIKRNFIKLVNSLN